MSTAPIVPARDAANAGARPAPNASPRTTMAASLLVRFRVSSRAFALVVSALILCWQLDFIVDTPAARPGDAITASSGLLPDLRYFFYFYYHLGLFPVGAKEATRLGPTGQDALNFVARQGGKLRMDLGEVTNTPRFGDFGKLWTLVPDAILRGDPAHASAAPFNRMMFIAALLALWWAFWRARRVLLGVLIVLLVGSNPFQLHETYARANIFSLPISVTLLALAAHLPYLTGRRAIDRGTWALALGSAVALATIREIRTEAAIVVLVLPATYLTLRAPWRNRAALILAFVVAWGLTGAAWTTYWSRSFERAREFVAQAGGRTYEGRHSDNHPLWHAIYCGLGDFGADKGFEWDDRAAFRWATTEDPVTNPRPLPYHYRDGYYLEETYDGVNHIAFTDLPEYNRLVRNRVVSVVRADPLWYARILIQRAGAILGDATPASLTVGVAQLRLPGVGWLLIPALGLLLYFRRTFEVKLLLFTLPLSAAALLVYSGRGMTNYGIAHLLALAAAIDLLVRARRGAPREGRGDAA